MDWIKKHYDQFLLLLVALALLAVSAMLFTRAQSFAETFDGIRGEVARSSEIPPLDVQRIQSAEEVVSKPPEWDSAGKGSLFVSQFYIETGNELIRPDTDGAPIHPPIPNKWILDNDLDIVSQGVLTEDPDKDGFSNLDEWVGADTSTPGAKSTDPKDPKSHPPYVTKLRLKQFISEPFRLIFPAWDGDPENPESITVWINTVDLHQPSQYLKIGDPIAGTKFKVTGFEKKTSVDPATEFSRDVSEITIENQETGESMILVKEQITNSPDSYALFAFLWDNTEIRVKKDGVFVLKPEPDVQYKLIDIKPDVAQIQNLKTEETHTIPLLQVGGQPAL